MSTLTELQELLRQKYDVEPESVSPDLPMQESGLDSLAIAEFMFAVEDHFHVTLPDDDPHIDTLNKLAELVDRLKLAKAAAALDAPDLPAAAIPPVTAPAPSSVTEER